MWILHSTKDYYICSYCGNEAYWDTDYGQQLFDYCPYCGEYNRKPRKIDTSCNHEQIYTKE